MSIGPWSRATRGTLVLGALLLAVLACSLPRAQSGQADLPGTITAQALTIQARAGTALTPTESPAAGAVTTTPTKFTAAPASTAAATHPPQPTNTPKATKTPKGTSTPTATVDLPGPSAPHFTQVIKTACLGDTANGVPWFFEIVMLRWADNSSDEDGFHIYHITKLHPEDVLVATLAPDVTVFNFQLNYAQSSVDPVSGEAYDVFYVHAFDESGDSPRDAGWMIDRCVR